MTDSVKFMRSQAEYFDRSDRWLFTGHTPELYRVVHERDRLTWKNLRGRVKEAFEWLFQYPDFAKAIDTYLDGPLPWWRKLGKRLHMFWFTLSHVERNLPDGKVGSIYTYWMEDGRYIMMMQPSVGSLLADFLEQEPDNPHAQKIREEMDKILEDWHAAHDS
jgi:hypothetical protein